MGDGRLDGAVPIELVKKAKHGFPTASFRRFLALPPKDTGSVCKPLLATDPGVFFQWLAAAALKVRNVSSSGCMCPYPRIGGGDIIQGTFRPCVFAHMQQQHRELYSSARPRHFLHRGYTTGPAHPEGEGRTLASSVRH